MPLNADSLEPLVSEVAVVTVCVRDQAGVARFFNGALGFGTIAIGTCAADSDGARMLRSRDPVTWTLVGPPGARSGLIRLVSVPTAGESIWEGYSTPADRGYYALNFLVPDVDAAWRRLQEQGAVPRSEPKAWHLWDDVTIRESMFFGPDGVLLDVAEVTGPGVARHNEPIVGVATSVCALTSHVEDPHRAQAFYTALGYDLLFDQELRGLESLLHVPTGTVLHDVNLRVPGRPLLGRLELVSYVGCVGRSRAHRAVPPNLGIIAAAYRTRSLPDALAAVESGGGRVLITFECSPFPDIGAGPAAVCLGPDDEALQLVEVS
jgi:catechol 2,3-dioxygenase-like lactoylglutathione lyase family enzyme